MNNWENNFFQHTINKYGKMTLGYTIDMMEREFSSGQLTHHRRHSYKTDRLRLWKSQNGFCWWCKKQCVLNGDGGTPNQFTVDHIFPLIFRGTNHWRNMVGSCYKCNKNRDRFWSKLKIICFNKPSEPITWSDWLGIDEFYEQ